MAGTLASTPTYGLTPAPVKVASETNYIKDFSFLNQYLPDTYEKEFERYGNRSIASFLRMVGAEMPTNSDMIKWSEQGRLHMKYTGIVPSTFTTGTQDFTITSCAFRVGQTVFISGANGTSKKAIVSDNDGAKIVVKYYTNEGSTNPFPATTTVTMFVYGSEFKKGTDGMAGSLEAKDSFFDNKPIIIKDNYQVSGSDMSQIGWVEVASENGATGYLWYIKSEHETRLRFEDYLEMAMVEGVPAAASSAALSYLSPSANFATGSTTAESTTAGTKGLFYEVENRGNVWSGGNPQVLGDFDAIIQRLDKQGAIQENAIFLNRQFSFDIDDMLAAQNSYGANGTSYGLFDNDKEMAINLGFTGFRRGYDFYKTDWKYLNDATLRGDITAGGINGVLVPAGSTNVYDQVLGKNAKRPFLHVRYRASETEDRRYKTWITGGAGGAATSDADYMRVNFLSERALCVLGANNFFLFKN